MAYPASALTKKCPACGASLTAGSLSCWKCRANVATDLSPEERFSSRWRRSPGTFAQRVTVDAPLHRLREGIQVDEGMRGALYWNGVLKVELGAGHHSAAVLWERLSEAAQTSGLIEAVIVMIDPVTSRVSLGHSAELYTQDLSAVIAGVTVRVELQDFALFKRRMLAPDSVLRDDDLMGPYGGLVAEVLKRHLAQIDVAHAARSAELRQEMEALLGEELSQHMSHEHGLRFGGVQEVRIDSPEIARVRVSEGGLNKRQRELEWAEEQRRMEKAAAIGQLHDRDHLEHEEHLAEVRRAQRGEVRQTAFVRAEGNVQHLEKDYEIGLKRRDRDWEEEEDQRDLKILDEVHTRQFEAMGKLQKLRQEKEAAKTRNIIDQAEGLKDVPFPIAAGMLSPAQSERMLRALEALRPLPEVTVLPQAGAVPAHVIDFQSLAQRYLPSVGVVVTGVDTGDLRAAGTAWAAANHGVLITNAHVAAELAKTRQQAWLIFSGQSAPVRVTGVEIHPQYGPVPGSGHDLPAHDVAVLRLETPPAQPGLPLASRAKLLALRELQPVAYLGFPSEGLVADGTSLSRPKAIAKMGVISSLEDWHQRHCDDPADRQLIKHDLGATGGASGSPLFDISGEVVGLVSGGNVTTVHTPLDGYGRTPNAVLINFAQRIDVLLEWMKWG